MPSGRNPGGITKLYLAKAGDLLGSGLCLTSLSPTRPPDTSPW